MTTTINRIIIAIYKYYINIIKNFIIKFARLIINFVSF